MYDNDYVENQGFWDRNKSLIIKILVILLCILILIWLISKIGKSSISDEKLNKNLNTIQLASEKYYFIDGNILKNNLTMTLKEMKEKDLVKNICDDNNNSCDNNSLIKIEKTDNNYQLKIKLSCANKSKTLTRYYSLDDFSCLNCDGKTYMNKVENNDKTDSDNKSDNNESNNNQNDNYIFDGKINNNLTENDITCKYSDWTNKILNGFDSEEIKIVNIRKIGSETKYSDWSNWTTIKIQKTPDNEVETKTESQTTYSSEYKSDKLLNDPNKILVRTTSDTSTTKSCQYTKSGNTCYRLVTKDLTESEYNNLFDKITNQPCNGVYNRRNSDGTYTKMRKSCTYKQTMSFTETNSTKTVYIYKNKITTQTTLYRFRNIISNEIIINNVIKDKIPSGYEIIPGSEITLYRYIKKICSK